VGTFAVASLSSTALMTIADMSTINVEVKVDETEIDKVAVGQKAKIKVDAFGEKEIEGEVTQKTPLAVGKSQTSGGLSTNINVQEAKEFRVVIQLVNLTEDSKMAASRNERHGSDHDQDSRKCYRGSTAGCDREKTGRKGRAADPAERTTAVRETEADKRCFRSRR
jgi:hypothetical protein